MTNTNYYCPRCGGKVELYFYFCCWCGFQLNTTEYSNIKEEEKTYFDKDSYTHNGPVPTIYYQ